MLRSAIILPIDLQVSWGKYTICSILKYLYFGIRSIIIIFIVLVRNAYVVIVFPVHTNWNILNAMEYVLAIRVKHVADMELSYMILKVSNFQKFYNIIVHNK